MAKGPSSCQPNVATAVAMAGGYEPHAGRVRDEFAVCGFVGPGLPIALEFANQQAIDVRVSLAL